MESRKVRLWRKILMDDLFKLIFLLFCLCYCTYFLHAKAATAFSAS